MAVATLALLCASVAWATTTTKHIKLTSGFTEGQRGWANAMNNNLNRIDSSSVFVVLPGEDLQAALDAADAGSVVQLGPGVWTAANDSGFVIRKPLTLRGAGRGTMDGTIGTVLRPSADGDSADAVGIQIIGTDHVIIEDLSVGFGAQPADAGSGHGIWVNNHALNDAVSGIYVRDVGVFNVGGHGVFYDGEGSYGVNISAVEDLNIMQVNRNGLYAYGCTGFEACRVYAHTCGDNGIELYGCEDAKLNGNYVEGNKRRAATPQSYMAEMYLVLCHGATVYGNNFEDFCLTTNATYALQLNNCYGTDIAGNSFYNGSGVTGAVSIKISNTTRGVRLGPNAHKYVSRTVDVDSDSGNQGMLIEPQSIIGRDPSTSPGYMSVPAVPDLNPITGNHEGNFSLVYLSQTALAGADSTAGYRIVGIGLPILNGIGEATDAQREGGITYDYVTKSFKGYNGTSWGTFGNAPTMSTTARNAATWKKGDLIVNSTVDSLQVYTGSTWRNVVVMTP